jgi:MoxR-like ATPase
MTPQEKFQTCRSDLAATLLERDDEIAVALTAIVTRELFVLVGPPGTAKSMMCDSLLSWIEGPTYSQLFTRFLEPTDVFGTPEIVTAIKPTGEKVTRIAGRDGRGMLQNAVFAICDELFNGSSSVLNTTLKIFNERQYREDGRTIHCPLWSAFAGTNHWPNPSDGGKEIGALFDRFLYRKEVRYVQREDSQERLMFGGDLTPKLTTTITPDEIKDAHRETLATTWSEEARDAFRSILHEARREGIQPGDRRKKKAVTACQGYAWLNGSDTVEPGHLEILSHVLWDDPTEQPQKLAEIVGRIANPVGMRVNSFLAEASEVISATSLSDMGSAIGASKKLTEILKGLRALNGDPRAAKARDYVSGEIKRIKLACVESLS